MFGGVSACIGEIGDGLAIEAGVGLEFGGGNRIGPSRPHAPQVGPELLPGRLVEGDETLDRHLTIVTPENLELRLPLAGPTARALAWIFDIFLQSTFLALLGMILSVQGLLMPAYGHYWVATMVLAFYIVSNAYFVCFELMRNGQSPGKRFFHLRCLRTDGLPLTPRDSLLRNLLRAVDWLPSGYALGVAVLLVGPRNQRAGDLLAGTVVVCEGPLLTPLTLPPATRVSTVKIADQGRQWIRLFRQWAPLMDRQTRHSAAQLLAAKLAASAGGVIPSGCSSQSFLAELESAPSRSSTPPFQNSRGKNHSSVGLDVSTAELSGITPGAPGFQEP